jgi:hypothetical protein
MVALQLEPQTIGEPTVTLGEGLTRRTHHALNQHQPIAPSRGSGGGFMSVSKFLTAEEVAERYRGGVSVERSGIGAR